MQGHDFQRPWTRRLAGVACAALLACGHEGDKAETLSPVPLAHRVDKLLDDPTALPRPGAGASAASDVAAPAADAGTAEPAPDAAALPVAVTPAMPIEKPAAVEKPAADKPGKAEAPAKERKPREEKPEKEPVETVEKKPPQLEAVQVPEGADATELFYSGKRKMESGNLQGAIADLRLSQQVRPSMRTLTLLGKALFDAGELSQAAKVLQAAGNHDEAQLLLGTLYQHQGKTAQARKVYEAFLKAHPDHPKSGWVQTLLKTL